MRHRKRGRTLGRSPSHRRAMLRNLASSLFLTERDAEFDENEPKVKGRIVTTLQKAKEVRPLVEKCVTIARHSLEATQAAQEFATSADRGTEAWKEWRRSEQWRQWNAAIAPAVAARRRALRLLGDKEAVQILFDDIALRMENRPGGYTRVLRLANFRLGDAGSQAILEFVGKHDRVKQKKSAKPQFEDEEEFRDEVDAVDAGSDEDVPADAEESEAEDGPTDETTAPSSTGDTDREQKN